MAEATAIDLADSVDGERTALLIELMEFPESDDPRVTAERAVHLLVPRLVDRCAIELLEDGTPRMIALAQAPPTGRTVRWARGPIRIDITAGTTHVGYLTAWLGDERRFASVDLALVECVARRISAMIERQRLRAAAEEALVLRDRFLAMAAHELRTPLQSMGLSLELLMARVRSSGDIPRDWLRGRVERTNHQVARMRLLIETLLDATNLRAGRLELACAPVDLAAVAREVVDGLREQLQWAGCPCNIETEETAIGNWDRLRLEIVVTNLVTNAMKYGDHRPISVVVRGDEQTVQLAVQDHGIGIALADRARLFRPFERLGQSARASGFGLGLWIVRQLVEAQGGAIHVESEIGAGSTFTVTLPR